MVKGMRAWLTEQQHAFKPREQGQPIGKRTMRKHWANKEPSQGKKGNPQTRETMKGHVITK
jgi:hypothetical protein